MSLTKRRFTADFKLTVVRAAEAGKTIGELARMYELNPQMVYRWQREVGRSPDGAFGREPGRLEQDTRIAELQRMIGELTMENALLKKALLRLEAQRRQRGVTTGNGSGR